MLCRHCDRALATRPRGLCWSCYYSPEVRELYPSTSKFARQGMEDFLGRAPLPPEPTMALPGSPGKVTILMERARRCQNLWHPQDASQDSGG